MRKIVYILFLIPFISNHAQEINFKASAPGAVRTGQQFQLVYSLNAKPKKFYAPDLRNFQILAGPSTSSSSNIQIINGKMTQSSTYTYTYVLAATKEGTFNVQPARATIDKKDYSSNPLTIKVVKGSTQQQQQQKQGQGQTQQTRVADESSIYAEVKVNKRNVYQGEAIIASVKFFSSYDIADYADPKMPKFEGFMVEDIDIGKPSFKNEIINGQTFKTVLFKKAVLIPQMTGEIVIEPFEWEILYNVRVNRGSRSIWDDFFGSYQSVKKLVKSKPVKVNVKPLPANKPVGFSGAVGSLKLTTSIDNNQVKANDAVTLKVRVSGNGNLKFIGPPKINFPPDFDVYDPKINTNVKGTASGLTGSKTFEYLMIPRHAGEFRISRFAFSYFDVNTKQYKNLSSNEFNITVIKGDEQDEPVFVSGFSKEDVKFFGKDIRFIKTGNIVLKPVGKFVFGKLWFYLVYVFGVLIFLIIVVIWKNRIKQNANIQRVKNKKANKLARKRLKTAQSYMKTDKKDLFFEEIIKAIWGYLSDKLSIPVSELSKESAANVLAKQEVSQEDLSKLSELIDNCEFARFAPSSSSFNMNDAYSQAVKIISNLESNLK